MDASIWVTSVPIDPPPSQSTTKMTVIKTRVAPEFKVRFNNAAKAMGLTESEFLRRAAEAALADIAASAGIEQGPGIAAGAVVELAPENAAGAQVTVRLAQFLLDGVKVRANSHGMSMSRWIASMIQSNLTRHPVVTEPQILALREHGRELAAIGRNLNQIARSMNFSNSVNPGSFTKEWMPMNRLDEVIDAIDAGMLIVSIVVRTSQEVWRID